jgi:hypothetical protein
LRLATKQPGSNSPSLSLLSRFQHFVVLRTRPFFSGKRYARPGRASGPKSTFGRSNPESPLDVPATATRPEIRRSSTSFPVHRGAFAAHHCSKSERRRRSGSHTRNAKSGTQQCVQSSGLVSCDRGQSHH